jgi:hypothetical protein
MVSTGSDACAHFVDKWLQREPEMQFAEVFCAAGDKARFRAWGALLHELRETLFELSDARVTGVKTGWWAEELMGLGQGRQRHPLSEALLGTQAPWSQLGRALLDHRPAEHRAANTGQAIAALEPTAAAIVAVESAIFGVTATTEASRSLAVHWLLQRLPQGLASEDQAQIPMHLFARHGLTATQVAAGEGDDLLRDWGRELSQAMPPAVDGAALIRRSQFRFDQARLARLGAGRGFAEPGAPMTLWRAWRAARSH